MVASVFDGGVSLPPSTVQEVQMLSGPSLGIILLIVLLILGHGKLSALGKSLGEGLLSLRGLKKSIEDDESDAEKPEPGATEK